jgi:hypothetical protein
MFDYVLHEGRRFQTKDTPDQDLSEYRIENGRLVFDEYHMEEVPKAERPYPNDDGLMGLVGSERRVVDKPNVDQNWHGYLYMVPDIGDPDDGEYRAKFTDGSLVEFVRLSDSTSGESKP